MKKYSFKITKALHKLYKAFIYSLKKNGRFYSMPADSKILFDGFTLINFNKKKLIKLNKVKPEILIKKSPPLLKIQHFRRNNKHE